MIFKMDLHMLMICILREQLYNLPWWLGDQRVTQLINIDIRTNPQDVFLILFVISYATFCILICTFKYIIAIMPVKYALNILHRQRPALVDIYTEEERKGKKLTITQKVLSFVLKQKQYVGYNFLCPHCLSYIFNPSSKAHGN